MNILWVTINNNAVDYAVEFNGTELIKTMYFQNPKDAKEVFDKLFDKWLGVQQ